MSPQRIMAIVLRQLYLYRGSPARILPLFGWVAIDVILWGFITRYLNSIPSFGTSGNYNFIPALLGAVVLWDFFTRVMQGVTMTFFEDVWSRNFLNVFATPLRISEYIAGLVLSSIGTSLIGLIIMLVLAGGFFGLSFWGYGLQLIPFLLVLFLCGIALGIFASALVLRMGPAAEWLVWPIPVLLAPFAAVFYPLSTLPQWMRWISHALPPSYIFEGMRTILAGRPIPQFDLLIGTSLAVIYLALAYWFFFRVYHHVVRVGLIARYSAETLS
jgi:ABC-2 type transport system permease protein